MLRFPAVRIGLERRGKEFQILGPHRQTPNGQRDECRDPQGRGDGDSVPRALHHDHGQGQRGSDQCEIHVAVRHRAHQLEVERDQAERGQKRRDKNREGHEVNAQRSSQDEQRCHCRRPQPHPPQNAVGQHGIGRTSVICRQAQRHENFQQVKSQRVGRHQRTHPCRHETDSQLGGPLRAAGQQNPGRADQQPRTKHGQHLPPRPTERREGQHAGDQRQGHARGLGRERSEKKQSSDDSAYRAHAIRTEEDDQGSQTETATEHIAQSGDPCHRFDLQRMQCVESRSERRRHVDAFSRRLREESPDHPPHKDKGQHGRAGVYDHVRAMKPSRIQGAAGHRQPGRPTRHRSQSRPHRIGQRNVKLLPRPGPECADAFPR